jgi:tetratricopeptide (TPR) repeat protein
MENVKTGLIVVVLANLLGIAPVMAFDMFSRPLGPVEEGNQYYQDQHYDKALERYEAAEELVEQDPRVHFNRGAALYKLGRPKEAREEFLRASGTEQPELKKKNYYNIGNTFLSEGSYKDAISYYRRALEIDSEYDDARHNLEMAVRAIKQQEQQQKESQDGDKDKSEGDKSKEKEDGEQESEEDGKKEDQDKEQGEQENKDDQEKQKEESQKDQEEQGQEKDQQQDQQQDQEQQQQEQQQQQPQSGGPQEMPEPEEGKMSKQQAMELLDAMQENEKPFQMHRFVMPQYKQKKVEKDW